MSNCGMATAIVIAMLVNVTGPAGADGEKIQGTWQVAEVLIDGNPLPAEKLEGVRMEFRAGVVTIHSKGSPPMKGSYVLKPNQKPRQLDLVMPTKSARKDVVEAIYEWNDNTLTICQAFSSDDKRPTEFASTKKAILMKLKKEKK